MDFIAASFHLFSRNLFSYIGVHDGEVTVTVSGAAPTTQYLIEFAAPDNGALTKIGSLTTNSKGNANFDKEAIFPLNTVGAGNIVLINNGSSSEMGKDEFYSGLV